MYKYRVIWFDDEHESLNIIKEKAFLNDVELVGFGNAKQGIEELERNIKSYDAAIIDGLFFLSSDQSGTPSSDKALLNVAMTLEKLSPLKKLPWFILSGQTSFTKETNRFADALKDNQVYDKLNDVHLENLWKEIKTQAAQQVETQLREKYKRVFEVCSERYIGTEANRDLLAILTNENVEGAFIDPRLYFNPLRKIMEDFFTACNRYGLMPDIFIKPSVSLNESSKFLSGGAERGYQLKETVFPKVVSDNIRSILAVCQPAAHRAEIDNFIAQVNTSYLLFSVTYQVLDVLVWFKNYIDSNSDIERNKSHYSLVSIDPLAESMIGIVEQDSFRNYHCGDIILTYKHVSGNGYTVGDRIRIFKTANNTNDKTSHLYSKSAISSEKI